MLQLCHLDHQLLRRGFDDLDDLILLRNKIEQILIVDAGIGVPSEAARVMELGMMRF